MANTTRNPPVIWAQRKDRVLLTILVDDCTDPTLDFQESCLSFKGTAGPNKENFAVKMTFYDKVVPQECKKHLGGRELYFMMKKKDEGWWPRLLKEEGKIHYLKTDFSKWKDEDDSDTEKNDEFNFKDMMNNLGDADAEDEEIDEDSDDEMTPDLEQ